jgi:probable rRNA maturation factor
MSPESATPGGRGAPDALVRFERAPRPLDRARLRAFAETLRKRVTGGRSFCALLTGDARLRKLNREFLGRDYATDVLSFPAPAPDALGDLAISWQRAAEQAAGYGHALETEIEILLLHGALHLAGYDHETDRGRMARAERKWRAALGLPAGLVERARR